MKEIIQKITQVASGLFSIALFLLSVMIIVGAGGAALISAMLVTATGLLIYGASAYITGFISMIKNREVKPALERVGLFVVSLGVLMLCLI